MIVANICARGKKDEAIVRNSIAREKIDQKMTSAVTVRSRVSRKKRVHTHTRHTENVEEEDNTARHSVFRSGGKRF